MPLNEADMEECQRNLDKLSESDRLLFRLLASTGMRLSEAFEMRRKRKRKRSCRFVIVGKKTEQSWRRVPLPASVLPFVPKKITGPLFSSKQADPADTASKHLNRFLNDCGIVDPRKVVHSLRHRAQDRLRAAECPEDIRWALQGHEERTVAAGYGVGFPVPMLKEWIDRIGYKLKRASIVLVFWVRMRSYDPWSYMPERRDRDRLAFVDGRKAMIENEVQADAIREKTTRLKALRLAREAAAKVSLDK